MSTLRKLRSFMDHRAMACEPRATVASMLLTVGAMLLSRLLPAAMHPGRRARLALHHIGSAAIHADERFAFRVLASRWRCTWLLNYLQRLPQGRRQAFLDSRVRFAGDLPLLDSGGAPRPLLLLTPHFGAAVIGCLAVARQLRDQRIVSVLYRRTEANSGVRELLTKDGARAIEMRTGVQGAMHALRALRRGGCLALMPDIYDDLDDTVAVPFLGRWLRAARGAAFLGMRADACIVPAYAIAQPNGGVDVKFSKPIDPRTVAMLPVEHGVFALTCRLFADIERELRLAPEHWWQWEVLPRISSPLDVPRSSSLSDVALALSRRCRSFPPLGRRVPEVAELANYRDMLA